MMRFTVLLCLVAMGVCTEIGNATERCCVQCGEPGACRTCRLVLKERTIEVVCWGVKRDPICVPGCSKPGCKHCEEVCSRSPDGEVCHRPKLLKWIEWRPSASAKIYTKNRLMKKVETRTVPSYEWVVEDLCPACQACCEKVAQEASVDIPKPPAIAAKFLPSSPDSH